MCGGEVHTCHAIYSCKKCINRKIIELLYRTINKLYLIKWIWNVSEKYAETVVEREEQIKNMHM